MESDLASPSANKTSVIFFILICCTVAPAFSLNRVPAIGQHGRRLFALVPSTPLVLQYHRGALLTGPESINVYILWYGNFSHSQKATVSDFIPSIGINVGAQPSVNSWWATTHENTDSANQIVSPIVKVGGQASDALCSLGKKLERSDITFLVRGALAKRLFPLDAKGIYVIMISADLYVERFCTDSCGFHDSIPLTPLEAVTTCAGIFGKGAYSGYPGELLIDKKSNASYNAYGVNDHLFLLPSMWKPTKFACETTLS